MVTVPEVVMTIGWSSTFKVVLHRGNFQRNILAPFAGE